MPSDKWNVNFIQQLVNSMDKDQWQALISCTQTAVSHGRVGVRWSACITWWMKRVYIYIKGNRGVSTPRLLKWITYPIFSAPAAYRPLLSPRQWSHVGGERRDWRGEEKQPLPLIHIQKKSTGSISINYNAPSVCSSQSGANLTPLPNACGHGLHPHSETPKFFFFWFFLKILRGFCLHLPRNTSMKWELTQVLG